MRIGIDIVEISKIKDTEPGPSVISGFLSEVFDSNIPFELHELAKWIAVNEAVFKSLSPRSQKNFQGVEFYSLKTRYLVLPRRHHKSLYLLLTKIQLSVSHTEDLVIAVAISRKSFLNPISLFLQGNYPRKSI